MTGDKIMSPSSAGPFPRRAAPEPNKRALYVGGLDPRVTEDVLRQIFETTGHVQNVKIIPDKNVCGDTNVVDLAEASLLTNYFLRRPKASITALWNTMILAQLSVPCRR